MVRSAGPPAAVDGVAQRHRVAGVADDDLVGQAGAGPPSASRSASALVRYDGDGAARPGAAGGGQAQRAGLAGATDDRDHRVASYRRTWRSVSAGAPQTSITASASSRRQVVGELGGDAAAEQDRVAVDRAPARRGRPSAARSSSITSGVRVSETRVAIRSPIDEPEGRALPHLLDGADEHAARAGDRVVHLAAAAHDLQHLARGPPRRRPRACSRELPEGRGVEVEPLHPHPDLVVADRPGRCRAAVPPGAARPPARAPGAGPPGLPSCVPRVPPSSRCFRATAAIKRKSYGDVFDTTANFVFP